MTALDRVATGRIPLLRRDGTVCGWALVDAADVEVLGRYRWSMMMRASGDAHAYRRPALGGRPGPYIYMARLIMGLEYGDEGEVDHRNGDGLDNRRLNLRVVTHAENGQNRRGAQRNSTTGVRGVCRCKQTGRWKARAAMYGKEYWLGRYDTIAEAEAVVIAWRRRYMPISEAS